MNQDQSRKGAETSRILAENARRERQVDKDRYSPWQPSEIFMRDGRRRLAARMLHRLGVFPHPGDACLEIGVGRLGWMADVLGWGLQTSDLHGIELDGSRIEVASAAFPGADLRIGNAADMPWGDGTFKLVVASTVFSSILDEEVRQSVAKEAIRVLQPGGALLWYDFRVDNPSNRNVRGIPAHVVRELFPGLDAHLKSVTLAPPIVRLVAPLSVLIAGMLEIIPILRTHLLGVMMKPNDA